MTRYAMHPLVFRPFVFSSWAIGGNTFPDFMHGTLDVWPILEGDVLVWPHVNGEITCGLHLPGDGTSDVGMWPYVAGDVRVDLYLGGKLEVNR